MAVIVLQNSLAPFDVADIVGQLLLETMLDVPEPNDYVELALEFSRLGLSHLDKVRADLDCRRTGGTSPQPLEVYCGTYWNIIRNFRIDIFKDDKKLYMRFQDSKAEVYSLEHYENDVFCWLMSYNETARRGRYINDHGAPYYLIDFERLEASEHMRELKWAWDPDMPGDPGVFTCLEA